MNPPNIHCEPFLVRCVINLNTQTICIVNQSFQPFSDCVGKLRLDLNVLLLLRLFNLQLTNGSLYFGVH
ncbi:hypothetical protein BLOT_016317 [Blomia tropicalis]|nr:hypothetical protein BLOT_016317 [Blomia tropicalis]